MSGGLGAQRQQFARRFARERRAGGRNRGGRRVGGTDGRRGRLGGGRLLFVRDAAGLDAGRNGTGAVSTLSMKRFRRVPPRKTSLAPPSSTPANMDFLKASKLSVSVHG
jgi:hypothetical protein